MGEGEGVNERHEPPPAQDGLTEREIGREKKNRGVAHGRKGRVINDSGWWTSIQNHDSYG